MAKQLPFKEPQLEQRLFIRRLVAAAIIVLILSGVLIGRLFQLQVFGYEHFSDLSQGNRIRIRPQPPVRGLIFDRNGVLLAENRPTWQLELVPEEVEDVEATLDQLIADGFVDAEKRSELLVQIRNQRRFEPAVLNYRVSDSDSARFFINRHHYAGVNIQARLTRHYPFYEATAHTVGYVGTLSQRDLDRFGANNYAGSSQVGKTGVEYSYEESLHGKLGFAQEIVNAQGRVLYVLSNSQDPSEETLAGEFRPVLPTPGSNVVLSLDIELQLAAMSALAGQRGAVVALDTATGDVLASVSTPSFDPNLFASGISTADYRRLNQDLDYPLFNRALAGTYPPGSTIKPILGLSALTNLNLDPMKRDFCVGFFQLPNNEHRYRDWKPEGHGMMDLKNAIAQSCDVYFYQLAVGLGIDNIHKTLSGFGMGSVTGIDIAGEKPGIVPSRDWKRRNFSRPSDRVWFPGETVITGIGQGYMLATPLQLAHAAVALANQGRHYQPRFVTAVEDGVTGERTMKAVEPIEIGVAASETQWAHIHEAMVAVVEDLRGSARPAFLGSDVRLAGKTGTAQVFSIDQEAEYDEEEVAERLRDHGLFIAYAPVESPTIALGIVVENGGGGSRAAAPVARQVLEAYFDGAPAVASN